MKTLLHSVIYLIFFSSLSLLWGCGGKDNESESVVLKSYRLIDEQRTDEAIELLEKSLRDEPEKSELKIVLASAYAHKGGVKIQKFVPLLKKIDELKKKKAEKEKKIQSLNTDSVDDLVIDLSGMLTHFSSFFEVYASVPSVSKDQSVYLRHSIYLLEEAQKSLTEGDYLYRAILRIILFKHTVSQNLMGDFLGEDLQSKECRFDLGEVNDNVVDLGKMLVNIFGDIAVSNTKEQDHLKSMSKDVARVVSDLTITTTSIIVLDEASNLFLKKAIIQQGFGKLIQCGND